VTWARIWTTWTDGSHTRGNRLWRQGLIWIGLTLTLLPATWYLWYSGLQTTHDGFYHKSRFFELHWMLQAGVIYPRWFPHLSFFYGSPVFHFYAPFIYYIAEGFHLLGLGFLASYEWMIGLGMIAAGWTMFAFARRWGTFAGWLAALVYVYWPYHMALAYVRGAQAELWGMVWYPLILARVTDLFANPTHRRKGDLLLALGYGALIFTHHLSAFEFTPVVIAYTLWWAWRTKNWRQLVPVALSLSLGILLAAFYWLPVLADIHLVWAGRPSEVERSELLQNLVPWTDILSPFWIHRYHPFQSVKAASPIPRVGTLFWTAAIIAFLGSLRSRKREERLIFSFFLGTALVAIFMLTIYSRPIWATLPLLHYLQFPWRLHTVIGFSVAMTIALGIGRLPNRHPWARWAIGGILLTTMAIAALAGIRYDIAKNPKDWQPLREEDVNLELLAQYDLLRGMSMRKWKSIWLFEYMPVWSAESRYDFFVPPDTPPAPRPPISIHAIPLRQAPLDRTFRVHSAQDWTFSLHQFYFPAWRAYVDGHPVSLYPRGHLGLLSFDIPAGEHIVRIRYEHTSAQRWAEIASLFGGIVWLGWAIRRRSWLLWVPALIGLYLLVATMPAWRSHADAIRPQPQDVQLGEDVRLIGSFIPRDQIRPGERVWFVLYWLAQAPPQERYKVIVHLTDEQGNTVANGDTEPGFYFTPTTRWEQGEIMEDWYYVDVPPDLPAGTYLLLTGMYHMDTIQNLPIQGGTQVGGRVLVGKVHITNGGE